IRLYLYRRLFQRMLGRKSCQPHSRGNRRGRHPEVHVLSAPMVLIHVHADHAFVEDIGRGHYQRCAQSQCDFCQYEHDRPSLPFIYSAVFLESIQMCTSFSASFTVTSSVSPCAESARNAATRSSSSLPAENSASTTFIGTLISTLVSTASLDLAPFAASSLEAFLGCSLSVT